MIDQFRYIGQVRKSHGVKGFVRLYIEPPFEPDFWTADYIYIDINGDFVPFFFESKEGSDQLYLVKFDDVHSPEKAKELASFDIYMAEDTLSPEAIKVIESMQDDLARKYEGYKIAVAETDQLLCIDSVQEYPHQWIASIRIEGKEVLIPLVDAFIVDINEENKILTMDLPEGMI